MSSVRDRVRHLQQTPEDIGEEDGKSSSVVQMAKSLETSAPKADSLVSRVARFDAAAVTTTASRSVQKTIPVSRSLIPPASRTHAQPASTSVTPTAGSRKGPFGDSGNAPLARRTASEGDDGHVASRVRATDVTYTATHAAVGSARRVFETQQKAVAKDGKTSMITSRAAAFEQSSAPPPVAANKKTPNDSVGSRVAAFQSGNIASDLKKKESADINTREKPASNVHDEMDFKGDEEKSLVEQLREVKAINSKLVKSLLDLTENYRRLELSRDDLQKRVAELELATK